MQLFQTGALYGDIAQQLGTHRDMITRAIREGHRRLGVPVPDGRTRRKELAVKGMPRQKASSPQQSTS